MESVKGIFDSVKVFFVGSGSLATLTYADLDIIFKCLIAVGSIVYIWAKVYFIFKNKGERGNNETD